MAERSGSPVVSEDIALAPAVAAASVRRRPWWIGPVIAAAIFAVLGVLGFTLALGSVTTLIVVLLYVTIAQGWNLLGGYGGYLNFGAAVLFGTGAYTAAVLNSSLKWGFFATLPLAAAGAVIVSLVIGIATLRLRSHYFAIFTLVLTFLAAVVVRNVPLFGGANGVYVAVPIDGNNRAITLFVFVTLLVLAIIATIVAWAVEHSRFGNALVAIKEDEPAAQVLGVRTTSVKLWALVIGAALAGAAGAVYAFQTGYIEPNGTFDVSLSLDIVLLCVVGGLGSWIGPLIGGVIVVVLQQWLRVAIPDISLFGVQLPAEASRLVLGVLLIVFALFARRGIVGFVVRRRGRSVTV